MQTKLGDIITQLRGVSFKSGEAIGKFQEGYIPFLRANNISKGELNFEDLLFVPEHLVKDIQIIRKGDIIIAASSGSKSIVGKAAMVKTNLQCSFGAFCKLLRPKRGIDHQYFSYFFQTPYYRQTISNLSEGANINNLKNDHINNLIISLPPLETQKKIAGILDKADELRRNDQNILEKYDQLARSVFLEMFGDPVTNPKQEKIVKLSDIATKITDGVHAKPNYTEKGIPFISVKDITTGKLKFNNCKYISEDDHNKYIRRCKPEFHDILYTKVGATYGRPAIVDQNIDFSIYVSVALIKPRKGIVNSYYLKEAMVHPAIKRQADKSIKGIGVPDLHLNMIKNFIIPLPDLVLQEKFARIVWKIEIQKQLTQQSLQKSEDLFQSLLQRAFKGELKLAGN